jgi:PAS domain S-box-containing protein
MENKILLVDDEEGIRKVLGISLADGGYEVFTAENGEEALKIFRQLRPAIVLTDIKMPGMDGITLLRHIKKECPDTEVIMITGHGDLDLAIKSLQHEAVDFVTKPINGDVLEIALGRAVEKITMREQLRRYTQDLEALVKEQSAKLVEAERLAAVGQAVEGLYAAVRGIADDLEGGLRYFNEMPCFVSVHNRELRIVEINQRYRELLGDCVGRPSWSIYCEENAPETCPVYRTFEAGHGQRSRMQIRFLDGRRLPVIIHTAPIRNSRGELELVLEIAADISEIQRLQETLRSTQQRYQQLFDEVPCYITVQDREFRLEAANRRFNEDFGDAVGSHCYRIYKQRSKPCRDCPVARTFEDGRSHQKEMVVAARNQQQQHLLIWTAPIRNVAGEIEQVMEMATDITQIRQLEDHLSSLGFLISSISHGIKGLLTGLDGGMYMIRRGMHKQDDEQLHEGWDVVQLMVERIRNMVRNILFYAKERELQYESVGVNSFAEDLCATVDHRMDQHDIAFERELPADLGKFEVDTAVMRSALLNVLENAVEAVLASQDDKHRRIAFRVQGDERHIRFHIADNGIGMDRETREQLFTLFFSSKGHAGTGLGLFISNRIVRQHGGWIEVDSAPGNGSRFAITVPRSVPQGYRNPPPSSRISHCA